MNAEEEEEAAQEEVDVEELVVALRHVDRDDLGQGQRQAQDHQDLAVEGRHDGLQGIAKITVKLKSSSIILKDGA